MRPLALAASICSLLPLCAEAQTEQVVKQLRQKFDAIYMQPGANMILINKGQTTPPSEGGRGKFGYANTLGEVVIAPTYDIASLFQNGFAVVGIGNSGVYKYGLIDSTGRTIAPTEWDGLSNVNSGVAVGFMKKDSVRVYSLVDTLGRITPLQYQLCKNFTEGLAVVGIGAFREAEQQPGLHVRAKVEFAGKHGYITPDGKLAVPCQFTDAMPFTPNGLAAVAVAGKYYSKWGFIDKSGKVVVPCNYYCVDSFSEGLSMVGKITPEGGIAFGYVDAKGSEVIPCRFDEATKFNFANTWVGVNKEGVMNYMLINKLGNSVIPHAVYNLQDGGRYGHAVVGYPNSEGHMLFGIMSIEGKMLLPSEYDSITIFSDRDTQTGQLKEVAIGTKNGEEFQFDISIRARSN